MAKKNNQANTENEGLTSDESAPATLIEKLAAAGKLPPRLASEERHGELREERRKLEAELAEINGKLQYAIQSGDVASVEMLTTRRAELPKLFIAASVAETEARRAQFNAEDEINVKEFREAEALRDQLRDIAAKRKQEFEAAMAELQAQLDHAEGRVVSMLATLEATHNLGASHDAGYKKSLAKLAGV